MTYSEAMEALKRGKIVRRKHWVMTTLRIDSDGSVAVMCAGMFTKYQDTHIDRLAIDWEICK